jgi:hypothetical protein
VKGRWVKKIKHFTTEVWSGRNIRYLPDCMNEPRGHSSESCACHRSHTIDRKG